MNRAFASAATGLDEPSRRALEAVYPEFARDVPWHDEPIEITVDKTASGWDVAILREARPAGRGGGTEAGVTYRVDASHAVTSKYYPR